VDRHPVRALPLITGLGFLALAVAAYVDAADDSWEAWLAPIVLLAAGGAVVALTVARYGRGR
jgi:hypothetical protein